MVAAGLSRSSVIAITRSTIERVAEPLAARGHIARGYIGVAIQPVAIPNALKQQLGLTQESGVMILNVEENGPAAQTGLLIGDVLLTLGDNPVSSPEDLHAALGPDSVGKQLPARVLRGGKLHEATVVVSERPGKRQ
jgi:S1-C subfamily serine protease